MSSFVQKVSHELTGSCRFDNRQVRVRRWRPCQVSIMPPLVNESSPPRELRTILLQRWIGTRATVPRTRQGAVPVDHVRRLVDPCRCRSDRGDGRTQGPVATRSNRFCRRFESEFLFYTPRLFLTLLVVCIDSTCLSASVRSRMVVSSERSVARWCPS